jgi:hypothetical protein
MIENHKQDLHMYRVITMDYACQLDAVKKELGTDSYTNTLDFCADFGRIEGNPSQVGLYYNSNHLLAPQVPACG